MAIEDLKWEGNSKEMYDKILSSAPGVMKKKAEEDFKIWVEKKGLATITEALFEDHIKETTPAFIQGLILAQITALKTK